jgi:hypothetical protein
MNESKIPFISSLMLYIKWSIMRQKHYFHLPKRWKVTGLKTLKICAAWMEIPWIILSHKSPYLFQCGPLASNKANRKTAVGVIFKDHLNKDDLKQKTSLLLCFFHQVFSTCTFVFLDYDAKLIFSNKEICFYLN